MTEMSKFDNNKIVWVTNQILSELVPSEEISEEEKFAVIGSNSIKAVAFLAALEDEFEIELDDESINARFFLDREYMAACIRKKLTK